MKRSPTLWPGSARPTPTTAAAAASVRGLEASILACLGNSTAAFETKLSALHWRSWR